MADCPDRDGLVEAEIDRVLTQYRESPKLLHMMRTYLGQVADVIGSICVIPSFFDIEQATGHQLTLLGQRLGWPRCHCVCTTQPLFGFECDGVVGTTQISGFCDDGVTWEDCGPFGVSEICLQDDDLYRKFLFVRRFQALSLYDLQSLSDAVQIMWGLTAKVMDAGNGRVVIAFGRELTNAETAVLQLYPRVLPIAPGINVRFHFGAVLTVFGFGEGWGGFCDPVDPLSDSFVGQGQALATESGNVLVTENGVEIVTGPLVSDAIWMCEVDVRPYDCAA